MSVSARVRSGSTAGWLLAAAVGLVVVALVVLGVSFGLGLFGAGEPERAAGGTPHLRPAATSTATPDTAAVRQRDARARRRAERDARRATERAVALERRAAAKPKAAPAPGSTLPRPAPTAAPPPNTVPVPVTETAPQAPAPSTPKPAAAPPASDQPVLGGGGDG
jgi:hypothetical protein